jgi:hypothetical protein
MNKQISSDLSKAVTSNIKTPIQEAFAAVFQETLVPSIEQSTQVMFRQIAGTFDKGLQDNILFKHIYIYIIHSNIFLYFK